MQRKIFAFFCATLAVTAHAASLSYEFLKKDLQYDQVKTRNLIMHIFNNDFKEFKLLLDRNANPLDFVEMKIDNIQQYQCPYLFAQRFNRSERSEIHEILDEWINTHLPIMRISFIEALEYRHLVLLKELIVKLADQKPVEFDSTVKTLERALTFMENAR